MPPDFWAGWVFGLTTVSVAGLAWFVWSIYFGGKGAWKAWWQRARGAGFSWRVMFGGEGAGGEGDDADSPVWDGNLREGAAPPPMWWFHLLLASLVVTVIYLMLYPGLGSFSGTLAWSQGGRLAVSEAAWLGRFAATRAAVAEQPLAALQADGRMMATAERVYARNCAACHGPDAQGQARLFPNLADAEWQWGAAPADVERSIRAGRTAVMVGWGAALGEDGVRDVADYVAQLPAGDPGEHPGKQRYLQFCTACHGADGTGQPLLGAPSLADEITLYGNDRAALEISIRDGRSGEMPAFEERLDDAEIRLLVAWLTRPAAPPGS